MNVWIINQTAVPPSMGGLVRHYYFSKYLQEDGHKVRILTASRIHNTDINMITDKSLYKEVELDSVEYTFVRIRDYVGNGISRIIGMLEFPRRIKKVVKQLVKNGEKPDVIYASSPSPIAAYAAILLAKKLKVKSVVEIRDLWPESIVAYNKIGKNNLIIKLLYRLEKSMYKKADRVIFTMPGGIDYIKDKGWDKSIDLDKIKHLNNGVDMQEFEHNKEHYQYEDPDLEDGSYFKIVYMGSVRKSYHIAALIEAAKKLSEKGDNKIKFLIYGDGTEKQELEEKAKNYGLKNIIFKGKVDKKYIASILTRSDLNLIHVKNTGLGKYGCSWNKLFEYFASGKPVLSNCPVAFDLIVQNDCGIVRKMETPDDYIEAIGQFLEMPKEEYGKMCQNSLSTAKQYDYRELTNQLEKILF